MKTIFPLILLGASVAIFLGVTQPIYERALAIRDESGLYNDALDKIKELQRIRDNVLGQFNSIPQEEADRLEKMVPETVDNVRFVRDLDTLARRNALSLTDIQTQVTDRGETSAAGILTVSFRTRGSYETFNRFLRDLEQSLRLMDIIQLTVAVGTTGTEYGVTLQTYWFNQ